MPEKVSVTHTHARARTKAQTQLYIQTRQFMKNKKVYPELCYYMENSILVAMATTLDDKPHCHIIKTCITRALRDMLGWVCLRKELMQSISSNFTLMQ